MTDHTSRTPRSAPNTRRIGPLTLAAALALTGCADIAGPTATPELEQAGDMLLPMFSATSQNADLMVAMLADLNGRVIPSLPDGSARQELADAFAVLSLALGGTPSEDGTVHSPRASLDAAQAALVRYGAAVADQPAAQMELESVKLGLSFIQLAVDF